MIGKTCELYGCKVQPSFSLPEESTKRFCAKHKHANMINKKQKNCESNGCNKRPAYNISSEKKGKYCNEHKEQNIINVISKSCEFSGCKKQPQVKQEQREKKLVEYVNYAMKYPLVIFANVLYLFYDKYNTQFQEWNTLIE